MSAPASATVSPHRPREPITDLVYLEAGPAEGELVVLLHGFPDLPTAWEHQLESLARAGFHAVAPYLPGYAPSTLEGPFDIDTVTEKVLTFAHRLRPGPFHLVGHDWGAGIAHYAASSGRLKRAVTLSVPHPRHFLAQMATDPEQMRRSAYMAFFQLPRLPERALLETDLLERLYARWSPSWRAPADHLAAVRACLRQSLPGPLQYYRRMVRPVRDLVRRFREARPSCTPMLYLQGAEDGCIAPEVARGQEALFTGPFESHVLPGGHFLPMEAPEAVTEAIVDWLGRSD